MNPSIESTPDVSTASHDRASRPLSRLGIARRIAFGLVAATVLLGAVLGVLLVVRYLPALDDARELRASLERAANRASATGLALAGTDLAAVENDVAVAVERHRRLAGLLHDDPLVALMRLLPVVGSQVRGADDLVVATGELLDAGRAALRIADRYVAIREAQASQPDRSAMAELVELMATSRADADACLAGLRAARTQMATIPTGLVEPIEGARAVVIEKLDRYLPVLQSYAQVDGVLPDALGWSGPRRYLVLAQDPAELRPTGGFIGTIGVVVFDRGRIAEKRFQDVYNLDRRPGLPYVEPPAPLKGHLLGRFPWRLADANWSPDFPTAAAQAVTSYALETGDRQIDGVVGLTTYAIDELLAVSGPIEVPEFGTTVAAGETTLRALQETRAPTTAGGDRKAFLDVFADRLLDRLFALPPRQWADLLPRLETIGTERRALVWLRDPVAQQLVAEAGWDGAVRQDEGDYVYAVDTNVAPTSKLNLVTERSLGLEIVLDAVGNARDRLTVAWSNTIQSGIGEPYDTLRRVQTARILGLYFRLLVPELSRLEAVSGGKVVAVSNAELIETESGRTAFGNYLMIPPGEAHLAYVWVSPYAANSDPAGWIYRLIVQKQPGTLDQAVAIQIAVPAGMRITETSPGLEVDGRTARLATRLTRDLELYVRYAPESAAAGGVRSAGYTVGSPSARP